MERKVLIRQSRNVGSGLTVRNLEDAVWLPYTRYIQAVDTSYKSGGVQWVGIARATIRFLLITPKFPQAFQSPL